MLEQVATASVALAHERHGKSTGRSFTNNVQPWALAAVAKASLVAGNDYRNKTVTHSDLELMCQAFHAVEDPFTLAPNAPGSLASFLVRTAYEQFPSQQSVFEELARTEALFSVSAASAEQSFIDDDFWRNALGCSLTEFVGLGLLLNIGALCNGGYYDPSWLAQPNFVPVLEHLPADVVTTVSARHFLATRQTFQATAASHRLDDRYLRRFEFNPLTVHPFVQQPDGRFIAPVPHYALTRVSPTGLYYIGLEHGGTRFTQALGTVFETYVGEQLGLLHPELLLHDVEYRRGQRAADWIVVLPRAVLVVEVKATPLSEGGRLGTSRLAEDLARAPGRAVTQIDRTVELIADGHPAVANVPRDRPVIGLIVTLQPYFQCNSELVWGSGERQTPVVLASSRELEHLVCVTEAAVDEVLIDLVNDPERAGWNLGTAIARHRPGRNPILDRAWDTYPFREVDDEVA